MAGLSYNSLQSELIREHCPLSARSASHRSVICGVGVNDADYRVSSGGGCPVYNCWKGMVERGHSRKYKGSHPAYRSCEVDVRWHSFMSFRSWYLDNHVDGYVLDKDILQAGNTVYGPETCLFVPKRVNSFIAGISRKDGGLPVGVHLCKQTGKYSASCSDAKLGKSVRLGRFDSPQLANEAWKKHKLGLLAEMAPTLDGVVYSGIYKIINEAGN